MKYAFSAVRFSKKFISTKATRGLQSFFDGIGGAKSVRWLITTNTDVSHFISKEVQFQYKRKAQRMRQMFELFSDDDVYNWIPQQYRDVIEAQENGKVWARNQLQLIKEFLLSAY